MPPEWLVKRVLLGPAPVRKAAASRATDEKERWMLLQPYAVRRSFVRDVLENGANEEAWMLLQPEPVRRSYVADVLGHENARYAELST
jgi:integrase